MRRRVRTMPLLAVMAVLSATATQAVAEIALSANDGKVRLVNGKTETIKGGTDTVAIIDLGANPPRAVAEIAAPTSVVGPPSSIAISPREDIALVTSATRFDPADPLKVVANDIVTVIELNKVGGVVGTVQRVRDRFTGKHTPGYKPVVLATLKAGRGASGIAINRAGTLALVANRLEGTISVFSISGKTVTPVGNKVPVGGERSGPSAIAFLPDGRSALVTRDGDNLISMLSIEGTSVTLAPRDISAGLRPYGLDVSTKGDVAVVANIGRGSGDADTVSLIDLTLKPPRVVTTVSVGQTPEGIKMSPDGYWVAVAVMNGSNKAKESPFFSERGRLVILRRKGATLTKAAEAPVGKWCQGIAWSANSKKLLVQCMVEQQILSFGWNGSVLKQIGSMKTKGGPAGIRTVER